MSRAIFILRGDNIVAILSSDLGNVNSTQSSVKTFSNIDIGSGSNRTIIVGVTVEREGNDFGRSTTITVDGVDCPQRAQILVDRDNNSNHCSIYSSELLSSQTGLVDIVIQSSNSPHS